MSDWNKMLSEALVRYDPVQSFRDGRFLTTRPWKFRDEAAISELLSHAVSTGLLDTQIDYCHPNDIFAVHPQWGWDLWNKWRMAQSDAVRIALEKKHSPELTAWQL